MIAESFERIHRSNLIGMGVLPLQFRDGESAETLGLTGTERFTISGLAALTIDQPLPAELAVRAEADDGRAVEFTVMVRIDTPKEADYYRHGGILPLRPSKPRPSPRLNEGDPRQRSSVTLWRQRHPKSGTISVGTSETRTIPAAPAPKSSRRHP